MLIFRCFACVIIAYLIGSLNFSIIISKCFLNKDIRDYGSGNAGTTNSYRMMGGHKTTLVIIGDILKGVAAIMLVAPIVGDFPDLMDLMHVLAGMAVVIGHAFPIFFGFRGGKGVLTTASVVFCLDWQISVIAVLVFLIIVIITRYVSLGSIIAVWTAPFQYAIFYGLKPDNIIFILFGAALAIFVTLLHIPNIKRLMSGTENKFAFKKKNT